MDFANKYLGGGVLGHGAVQEEIRFSICPELISSMLFMECMEANEAIIVQGFEQFSKYKGYSRGLEYDGDYNDKAKRYVSGNILTSLMAIDAVPYRSDASQQYQPDKYLREVTKAYAGFLQPYPEIYPRGDERDIETVAPTTSCASGRRPIATGNWGCGAFGGDPQFKAMLQWIAASQAQCPEIAFHTFNDPNAEILSAVVEKFTTEMWTVKDLFDDIARYAKLKCKSSNTELSYFETVLIR